MKASPAHQSAQQRFEFVREWDDEFLSLFPHRGDYLWAKHPEPGNRPEWQTESKHLLSDRLIQQGAYLYGVRFGATTKYLLIDIDVLSAYHPQQDVFAIGRMVEALEAIGLVSYVAIFSSDSNGIHLYFPFEKALPSWKIALAAQALLAGKGFKLQGGQAELFPNPKPYSEAPINYNGHRLPLQQGSYLLNADWNPIFTTQTEFVRRWGLSREKNAIALNKLEQIVQAARRKTYGNIKADGQKYLNDLTNDIEAGWTSSGQTQFLLGKIANRERVFYHAIYGGQPLEGKALADRIAEIARSLPGYEALCGHQHEINKLAEYWARAAERRYYPYGSDKPLSLSPTEVIEPSIRQEPTWNERQSQAARERVRVAIADLLEKGTLPAQATARRTLLRTYKIANTTLDKNRDLWHPESLKSLSQAQYHTTKPEVSDLKSLKALQDKQYHPQDPNKLFSNLTPATFDTVLNSVSPSARESLPNLISSLDLVETKSCSDQKLDLLGSNLFQFGIRFIQAILDRVIKPKSRQRSRPSLTDSTFAQNHSSRDSYRQLELPVIHFMLPTPSISNSCVVDWSECGSTLHQEVTCELQNLLQVDRDGTLAALQVGFAQLAWSPAQIETWIVDRCNGKTYQQLVVLNRKG